MGAPADDVLDDLAAEYARIETILASLTDAQWDAPSAAPGWTIADTVFHLAATEEGVVSTLATADDGWTTRDRPLDEVIDAAVRGRTGTSAEVFNRWRAATATSIAALAVADPNTRVRWAAAPLKPRTLATTRLAEHWAHMLDITGPLGIDNPDTDRVRHIAWLGHSTLPYAMRLAGLEPAAVYCSLTAPSRRVFTYGPTDAGARITGAMGAFCRVGARRLDAADAGLRTTGGTARDALRVLRNYAA